MGERSGGEEEKEDEDEGGDNRCAQRAARAHGARARPRGVSHPTPPLGARARALLTSMSSHLLCAPGPFAHILAVGPCDVCNLQMPMPTCIVHPVKAVDMEGPLHCGI